MWVISLSTLVDQLGAVTKTLKLSHALIEAHLLAVERLQGDDTKVPLLARGGTKPAGFGPMSATITPSPAPRHQLLSAASSAIAAASSCPPS